MYDGFVFLSYNMWSLYGVLFILFNKYCFTFVVDVW